MILVIGATGSTGRLLVHRLAELRVPTRALVRPGSLAAATSTLGRLPGVEIVPGDVGDDRGIDHALHGVCSVFLAMANGPDQLAHELAVVRATARSDATLLVKVSAPVVGPDVPVAVARLHHEVEQAVVASGLGHAFLRPYAFFQNLLKLAPVIRMAGYFTGITGETPMNMVDARDIAAVAAVALTSADVRGPLVLTGPETVSYPDVARSLTAAGRPTRYVDLTPAGFRRGLERASLPSWLVDHLEEIQTLALMYPEQPTPTVETITGRLPRALDTFLSENLDRFAAPRGWRERLAAVPLRITAPRVHRRVAALGTR